MWYRWYPQKGRGGYLQQIAPRVLEHLHRGAGPVRVGTEKLRTRQDGAPEAQEGTVHVLRDQRENSNGNKREKI